MFQRFACPFALMGERRLFEGFGAVSFRQGLETVNQVAWRVVWIESQHGFELAPSRCRGIGTLGLQLAVFGVEPVAGIADVFQDILDETVDGVFEGRGGDVVQSGLRNEYQGTLRVAGIGVNGDANPRTFAPDRYVRPMVSGTGRRQVMRKPPFRVEVLVGRWLPAYAPPVVDEPEGQRQGRGFQRRWWRWFAPVVLRPSCRGSSSRRPR